MPCFFISRHIVVRLTCSSRAAAPISPWCRPSVATIMLSHYEGCTSREVSAMTGLNESTVRVHLFRAIRRLRSLLAEDRDAKQPGSQSAGEKRRVNP